MQEVRKIEMAVQQLQDALTTYFNGRYHSALVLAAASEQLFAGYLHLHKLEPAFKNRRRAITKIASGLKSASPEHHETTKEGDIGDLLNRAYNHSHHAGKTELELHMNPKLEAKATIDRAISNFDALVAMYDLPLLPLAQTFIEESLTESASENEATDSESFGNGAE